MNKKNIVIFISIILTFSTISLISLLPSFFQENENKEIIIESTPNKIKSIPNEIKSTPIKIEIKEEVPDFSSFKDVNNKKIQFFEFIYPMVVNSNLEIIKQRQLVKSSTQFNNKIKELCQYYRVDCNKDNYKESFLKQVNIIPPSLTLAQAANESAWGTSRFAKKANNYFGQWCFTKGCGIIPKQRNNYAQHEVQSFQNVSDSVHSYIRNLNSHPAYKELREIRNQKGFNGNYLAEGLSKYSERGQHYIEEIQSMINYNKLQKYDKKMIKYLLIK